MCINRDKNLNNDEMYFFDVLFMFEYDQAYAIHGTFLSYT